MKTYSKEDALIMMNLLQQAEILLAESINAGDEHAFRNMLEERMDETSSSNGLDVKAVLESCIRVNTYSRYHQVNFIEIDYANGHQQEQTSSYSTAEFLRQTIEEPWFKN